MTALDDQTHPAACLSLHHVRVWSVEHPQRLHRPFGPGGTPFHPPTPSRPPEWQKSFWKEPSCFYSSLNEFCSPSTSSLLLAPFSFSFLPLEPLFPFFSHPSSLDFHLSLSGPVLLIYWATGARLDLCKRSRSLIKVMLQGEETSLNHSHHPV